MTSILSLHFLTSSSSLSPSTNIDDPVLIPNLSRTFIPVTLSCYWCPVPYIPLIHLPLQYSWYIPCLHHLHPFSWYFYMLSPLLNLHSSKSLLSEQLCFSLYLKHSNTILLYIWVKKPETLVPHFWHGASESAILWNVHFCNFCLIRKIYC